MSTPVKKTDAEGMAFSAIEEALNLAAKETPLAATPVPFKKKAIEAHEEVEPLDEKLELAIPDPVFAAPTRAANDEKSEVGQLLYMLGRKPSNRPIWIAAIAAALWVALSVSVSISSQMFGTGQSILTALILIIAPPMLFFGFAFMTMRANEMRMVARGMSEVALRLAEPENVARDAVASVGQAIRREVETMNEGMNSALSHAKELEQRVSREVTLIDEAFNGNAQRIKELVAELAMHRDTLASHSTQAHGVISTAHNNLVSELSSRSDDLKSTLIATQDALLSRLNTHNESWTGNLTSVTEKLLNDFSDKSKTIGDEMAQAGYSVLDTINMRSTDIVDKLNSTGEEVVAKLVSANNDVAMNIKSSSEDIVSTIVREVSSIREGLDNASLTLTNTLSDHSVSMTRTMQAVGSEVTQSLNSTAGEVNSMLKHTGDSLVLDLGLRGTEVTQKLDETGSRIAEYITDKGNALADRISETGNRLYETVNVHGLELDKRLAETGSIITEALATRTAEAQSTIAEVGLKVVDTLNEKAMNVQSALHIAGDTVSQTIIERTNNFKTELSSVGDDLLNNFATRSLELSDKLQLLSTDFGAKITDETSRLNNAFEEKLGRVEQVINVNGTQLTTQIGTTVSEMSQVMKSHVTGFEDLSNRLSLDVSMKLTDASSSMADKIRTELGNFDEKVSAKTLEITSTLDERMMKLDASLVTGAQSLNSSLADRAIDIAKSFSEGGQAVTNILEKKATEMTNALIERAETINSALGAKALEVAGSLEGSVGRIKDVSQSISTQTDNLAHLFDEKGNVFITNLGNKGEQITSEVTKVTDIVVKALETRGGAIAEILTMKSAEVTKAMRDAGQELASHVNLSTESAMAALSQKSESTIQSIATTSDGVIVALNATQDKVSDNVNILLGSIASSNEQFTTLASNAQHNLIIMDEQLGRRMTDLQQVVDNVTQASQVSVGNLDKQVTALQQVSGGTLSTLTDLTTRIEKQSTDLHTLNEFFVQIQSNFNDIIEERRVRLDALVKHMGDKSSNMEANLEHLNQTYETTLTRHNESIKANLTQAQTTTQDLVSLMAMASKEQANSVLQHVETLHLAYGKERDNSQGMMQTAYDTTLNNVNALYMDSAAKFNELTNQLRSVSNDIARELEATRAELKKGLVDMPRETQEHAGSMRRVVADQMQALAALKEIVTNSGHSFDVAPSHRNDDRRYTQPLKVAADPVISEPLPVAAKPPQLEPKKKGDSWISDLLARATDNDEAVKSNEPQLFAKSKDEGNLLESLPHNIQKLIDHPAAIALWDKYRRGEKNAFNRRIYTLQGQKYFDDIRRNYYENSDFRVNIDRYIDDFELMLSDINRDSRDPNVTRNMLVSDTGKTYTILAHASGRFD